MGSARLKLTLSPTAYVEGEYRRDFSLFQGVTDEVYATDIAYLRTGAMLTSRLSLMLGATYSNWQTPVASGVYDTMNIYGAIDAAAFRALGERSPPRWATTTTTIATRTPARFPEGFPAEYDRNAVRWPDALVPLVALPGLGSTVWVPLAAGTVRRWPPPLDAAIMPPRTSRFEACYPAAN